MNAAQTRGAGAQGANPNDLIALELGGHSVTVAMINDV